MSSLLKFVAVATWLATAAVFAGPAVAATAPAIAPAAKAPKHITLKFKGTLREALKAIADKGGINLVITGELKDPAEVYLSDVSGEEALQIVADAHGLKTHRQGSIWTIRPLSAEERASNITKVTADDHSEGTEESSSDSDRDDDEGSAPTHLTLPTPPTLPTLPTLPTPPTPPTPPSGDSLDMGHAPDPVADPRAFQRYIEQRVQRDMRTKMMRKLRSHHTSHNDNDLIGRGQLMVDENQTVDDVVSYGGGVDVKGHVNGDVVAFGGGVHLFPTAECEGDVVAFGGNITKDEGSSVEGEEHAFGTSGLGKVVASSVHAAAEKHSHEESHPSPGHSLPAFLAWFAVLFGGGFLAMMFAPNRMKILESELRSNPLRCGVTGLLGGVFGLPTLSVVLAVTIVGIPVIPVLWFVAAIGALMGAAALANEIGTRLPLVNVRKTQAVVLALGVLVMELIGLVPVLGALAWLFVGFLSLGAVIRSRFGTRPTGLPQPV